MGEDQRGHHVESQIAPSESHAPRPHAGCRAARRLGPGVQQLFLSLLFGENGISSRLTVTAHGRSCRVTLHLL